jgi:hypothetical protein
MTSGEYLFTIIIASLYTSAWWSLFIFPDDKTSDMVSGCRLVFLGLVTILMFWYVIEKLVTESRERSK